MPSFQLWSTLGPAFMVAASAVLANGCQGTASDRSSPQPSPSPTPNPLPIPETVKNVRNALATRRRFRTDQAASDEDKHKAFFVWRRAETFIRYLQPQWTESQITDRIDAEFGVLLSYVEAKLGSASAPGPLGAQTEPGSPPATPPRAEYTPAPDKHLDLSDVASPRKGTIASEANTRAKALAFLRRRLVRAIVWRAAAIHPQLWEAPTDTTTAKLADDDLAPTVPKMDAVVDRRLRVVERMNTQVANSRHLDGSYHYDDANFMFVPGNILRKLDVRGRVSDWIDGYRVRPFEYPRVYLTQNSLVDVYVPPSDFERVVPSSDRNAVEPLLVGGPPWYRNGVANRYEYNVVPVGVQLPGASAQSWVEKPKLDEQGSPLFRNLDETEYDLNLEPAAGQTCAGTVDLMRGGKFDWWNRTWAFCDHVLSALQVEALLFSLRRRGRTALFEDLGQRDSGNGSKDYWNSPGFVDTP